MLLPAVAKSQLNYPEMQPSIRVMQLEIMFPWTSSPLEDTFTSMNTEISSYTSHQDGLSGVSGMKWEEMELGLSSV